MRIERCRQYYKAAGEDNFDLWQRVFATVNLIDDRMVIEYNHDGVSYQWVGNKDIDGIYHLSGHNMNTRNPIGTAHMFNTGKEIIGPCTEDGWYGEWKIIL